MINQPETQGSSQQGKLILPAYPDAASPANPNPEIYPASSKNLQNEHAPIRPEQLIRQKTSPPPMQPLDRLRYYWQKEPAYKVLMIAIAVVVIAALVFVSLVSNAMMRNPNTTANDSTSQNPPTVVPTGTLDLRPTFPAPVGGSGSSSSSQPPAHSTPVLPSTPNASPTVDQATPTPGDGGPLSVTINSLPNRVSNNSTVNVSVTTSQPNVTVVLAVAYGAPPYKYISSPTTTDGGGNGNLSWAVTVFMFGRHTQAVVYAVAQDQNGQRVQSQPVSVQIGSNGGD
ncbi:MAG: hypothetical protein E6I91_19865 [Chloroflexi bacterium]|nr:MAG: hypothetical protein E6I91_19865 [Chloroflexota bacterium]